jgi:hypothetical protein
MKPSSPESSADRPASGWGSRLLLVFRRRGTLRDNEKSAFDLKLVIVLALCLVCAAVVILLYAQLGRNH